MAYQGLIACQVSLLREVMIRKPYDRESGRLSDLKKMLVLRPTVCNVIIGARTQEQLKENFGAVGWQLTADQLRRLDGVSEKYPVYPYWHQRQDTRLAPMPTFYS